jgi:hypothetical protein
MKPTALLVNTSRAPIVEEGTLVAGKPIDVINPQALERKKR